MGKLDQLRDQIDKIDDDLLKIFNRRAGLAEKIGQEKTRQNKVKHFHVPGRERSIIDRLKSANQGPLSNEAIEQVFREIFSATLALEKPLRIGYLGPETTFSHQVAVKQFGRSATFIPQTTIENIFFEVEQGHTDYGVVPIENSTEGVVNLTLDCFVDSPLVICDERKLEISLSLLSKSGDLKHVKEIYSHPQPLAQCRNWLNKNAPGIEQIPTSSTAQAAIIASKNKNAAAVAGKMALDFYNLKCIKEKIEDRANNNTRFLVIGKEKAKRSKANKTSIMFSINDEAGSLLKVLQTFARHKINLTKIQSRPLRNRIWEYLFFVDFDGHIEDETIEKVTRLLSKKCLFLKVLGSYPKKTD
ncbi:MAG: prephenate dehydratase [Nitrospinales bacterium]